MLTVKEKKIIQAVLDSEYGDNPTDDVWTMYLAEDAGLPAKSMGGIVSSLVKKGLARANVCKGMGSGFGDMDTLGLTIDGVAAAQGAGLTSLKMENIVYAVNRKLDGKMRVSVEFRDSVKDRESYEIFDTLAEARNRAIELEE